MRTTKDRMQQWTAAAVLGTALTTLVLLALWL